MAGQQPILGKFSDEYVVSCRGSSFRKIFQAACWKYLAGSTDSESQVSAQDHVYMEEIYCTRLSLPNQDVAFRDFLRMYPLYLDTLVVDNIRDQEYSHLEERPQVCLDYAGVGLFSHSQQVSRAPSCALGLSYISTNLATHALYTADELEMTVRRRLLRYMNIDENEYAIVFTANEFSALKLLGESYPFHLSPKLLLGYDHQCESHDWFSECAKSKGVKVMNANLMWPSLKLDGMDMKKKLQEKRQGGQGTKTKGWGFSGPIRRVAPEEGGDLSPKQETPIGMQGLMVYPFISRASGAKNSLQWVREAGQNGWHVLLDVSGLGAKAMDSLGLNLFHPDFIVGSFYKVFGSDPTGFGCLVIKKSLIRSLGDSSRARAIGMVRIVSSGGFSHCPVESSSSVIPSSSDSNWSSSSSSSSFLSPATSMERHSGGLNAQKYSQGDHSVFGQPDEKFSSRLRSQMASNDVALGKLPKGREQLSQIFEQIVSGQGKWRDEESSAASWVRSQSSPSSFTKVPLQILNSSKTTSVSGRRDEYALTQQQGKNLEMPRRAENFWSEEIACGVGSPSGTETLTESKVEGALKSGRAVRYLQIPHRGRDQAMGMDDENLLFRDFGRKSPLMLTLPRGFDSPGGWSPPSSTYGAQQEILVGSLPETPSSVSAPCSPRYPRLLDEEEEHWGNPDLVGDLPEAVVFRGLDHADKIGVTRINFRLRALINWLISSLRRLRHPSRGHPYVVIIYGPLCQVDRGPTFAFNIADSAGRVLDPVLVQRLADRNNISLGTAIIKGTFKSEVDEKGERDKEGKGDSKGEKERDGKASSKPSSPKCIDLARQKWNGKGETPYTGKFSVLCAALGFLSSFSDVFRLWVFAAQFLDSEFVSRELFHYRALNQQTILM